MVFKNFRGITIRGLTAYGICCLESTLLHFNLQNDEGWRFLVERFWLYTELPEFLGLSPTEQLYPTEMKDMACLECFFGDISDDRIIREVEGKKYPKEENVFNAEMVDFLYQTYKRANDVVLDIMSEVENVAFVECNGWCEYPTYVTLEELEMLINTMRANNIPLPDIEPFKKYSLDFDPLRNISHKAEAKAWGAPFDGRNELSKILK